MKKLAVISDLWGVRRSQWWRYYVENLSDSFDVAFYDACALGQIDLSNYTEEALHQQFINGGIDKAVENLLKIETQPDAVLGFSIGGYIAFKSLQNGLKTNTLFAVSSSRLRKETDCPKAQIQLFYGENDLYKPSAEWFAQMNLTPHIFKGEPHDFYQKEKIATQICDFVKNRVNN